MANSAGVIKESIWRDRDFRALSRTAQATYLQLISQKELDRAGLLPLQPTKWVKGCDAMSLDDLYTDLKELQATRFVFVDVDTDEVFVRSYMRQSNVISQPNLLKNAYKCASMVDSEYLRHELATELRRLGRKEAQELADSIDPGEGFEMPSETLPEPKPIHNPSQRVVEPLPKASETHPEPLNPSGTLPEPTGVGEGEGVGVTTADGDLGGSRARARVARETPTPHPGNEPPTPQTSTPQTSPPRSVLAGPNGEPPQRCPKHAHVPDGEPVDACGPCAELRKAHDRWTARRAHAQAEATATANRTQAELTRAEIDACDLCDDHGYELTTGDGPSGVCRHNPNQAAVNARGRQRLDAIRAQMAAAKAAKTTPEPDADAQPEPEQDPEP
ncbi:replication initiation protein [Gordonia phage Portcullis]|uniref:Helix-turn-helix DNA binding domain protein n=1 Tax=Gordonia phage Portcullis TaxID=2762414 RepID=A0A7G8LGK5_9CAUD|nr:replication initiation protein [Gordonia phage Portcullis]QNJ56377.1 helix-turn-helix DNA binding domain protein [Gordonia phage Portcullis]